MVQFRRGFVRHAAILLLIAVVSCNSSDGTTGTRALDTSSSLPPPSQVAAGTGFEAPAVTQPSVSDAGPVAGVKTGKPSTNLTTTSTLHRGEQTSSTTTTTATTLPPGLPEEKCPEAKTCRRGAFLTGSPFRWPTGANGRATVHYEINMSGAGTKLTHDQVRDAIGQAFATWQSAAPTLEFVFDGFTSQPIVHGDGRNTISFVPSTIRADTQGSGGDKIGEADMYLGNGDYVWHPCQQRDGSCTPVNDAGRFDLQAIATHEIGHWIGLDDMPDSALDRELTMFPGDNQQMTTTDRHWVTLALGDVLWLRKLYPCSCPLSPIYSP